MKINQHNYSGRDATNQGRGAVTHKFGSFALKTTFNTLAVAITLNLGIAQAAIDIPSDLPPSPLFGALDFSQQMLRFEEFGVHPIPTSFDTAKSLPSPAGCDGRPSATAMDAFLLAPLWPAPTQEANVGLPNEWTTMITTNNCLGEGVTISRSEERRVGKEC